MANIKMSEKLQNYLSTFIMASYNNPDIQISREEDCYENHNK